MRMSSIEVVKFSKLSNTNTLELLIVKKLLANHSNTLIDRKMYKCLYIR